MSDKSEIRQRLKKLIGEGPKEFHTSADKRVFELWLSRLIDRLAENTEIVDALMGKKRRDRTALADRIEREGMG